MNTTSLNATDLKAALKAAFLEILEEQRDVLRDIFMEALEDAAIVSSIEEGADTADVSRHEVFAVLEGVA